MNGTVSSWVGRYRCMYVYTLTVISHIFEQRVFEG